MIILCRLKPLQWISRGRGVFEKKGGGAGNQLRHPSLRGKSLGLLQLGAFEVFRSDGVVLVFAVLKTVAPKSPYETASVSRHLRIPQKPSIFTRGYGDCWETTRTTGDYGDSLCYQGLLGTTG